MSKELTQEEINQLEKLGFEGTKNSMMMDVEALGNDLLVDCLTLTEGNNYRLYIEEDGLSPREKEFEEFSSLVEYLDKEELIQ